MITAIAAVLALQLPGPATINELADIVSNAGICDAIGYDASYEPMENWMKAIIRAEPDLTYSTAMVIFDARMEVLKDRVEAEADLVDSREEHVAAIEKQEAICERYLVDYPTVVTRLVTTNTMLNAMKQMGTDRFPE